MASADRDETTPFLLKLFYRTGAFHRPDEFKPPSLPPYIPVYTWKKCSLSELSRHLAAAANSTHPPLLPDPAIGTRLVFRLIFADTRSAGGGSSNVPRYVAKDLGSVVIGDGGPGIVEPNTDEEPPEVGVKVGGGGGGGGTDDGAKTLSDAKFVIGDYISCAILPPSELTGDVQPASSARMGRGTGAGIAVAPPSPPPVFSRRGNRDRDRSRSRDRGRFDDRGRARGFGSGRGRDNYRQDPYPRGGRDDRGGKYGDRDRPGRGSVPQGEWRRGERLPDPPMRSGGGGRWPR
ncbi:Sin3 associated polypeptide p18-domain-containing protein [Diplogelasinospora grovesii]|uniref:Sin3 associated polypeptide p18-domain-containing protein n=1 Tax=Diplogelasinospora grovesii TaxID=303347 RepID=A0AAN6NC30_9PEZI|nr:Sin3 associated polypeptide p18-domain-containing protein [Diplogelasinospora grovesii]